MFNSICVLGRQPALGLAELESLYGGDAVAPVGKACAGLSLEAESIDFARLGGSTRLAAVLGEVPSNDWRKIEKALVGLVRSSSFALPTSGKFHLGVSAYGFDVSPAKLNALGLTLKKIIRARDISVRTVPNQETELNTAQVYHNKLATEHGAELLIIADGANTVIARTTTVQDIDSYTLRDRGRPRRDARVGMLPPKLAQTIVNLAVGTATGNEIDILDPFCGTGVILQEAMLNGFQAYGSDLEPRMVDYTLANLEWLQKTVVTTGTIAAVRQGDATNFTWPEAANVLDAIACETYLGKPFTTDPDRETLNQTVSDVNLILKRFLQNLRPQIEPNKHIRLCLAVPCWFVGRTEKHLPLVENLSEFGFKRVTFKHVKDADLIYHREEQIVGRELLVLEKA